MPNLGETNDPTALILGNPATLNDTVQLFISYGDMLTEAGTGLSRIDTSNDWTGTAAAGFHKAFHGQPAKWTEAGNCFHDAAAAIDAYITTLTWAQSQAAEAIQQWPTSRQAAQQTLDRARSQLNEAGNTAADAVDRAKDKAPPKPGFWSQLGSGIENFASSALHDLENTGKEIVNGVASFGNAAIHHPGEVAGAIGGLGLTVISAAGEGGGLALDATGIGAIAGGPLTAVSAAGMATGASITGASIAAMATHAAGDDHVEVFKPDSGSAGSSEKPPFEAPKEITGRTAHGEQQIQTRDGHGVNDEAVNDAVMNPTRSPEYVPDKYGGYYKYTGKHAIVSLNEAGKVVTAWARDRLGWRNP